LNICSILTQIVVIFVIYFGSEAHETPGYNSNISIPIQYMKTVNLKSSIEK